MTRQEALALRLLRNANMSARNLMANDVPMRTINDLVKAGAIKPHGPTYAITEIGVKAHASGRFE